MPTKRFAIDRGGEKRLSISWGIGGRNLRVLLDGLELPPTAPGGRDFRLPDGRPLAVDVDARSGVVDVICDGAFLPGTRFDPYHQLLLAAAILFVLGGLHIAAAFLPVAEWFPGTEGLPIVAAGVAVFYLAAGLAVSRRSRVFLYLSTLAATLEAVILAIALFLAGLNVKLLLLLFLPLAPLFPGFSALEEISIEEESRPAAPIG